MRDLEERCLRFSLACRDYLKSRKWDEVDRVYKLQLARPSSSIGANYIEANENLGKQDLLMRLKISRKEAKETLFWLKHLWSDKDEINNQLQQESEEMRRIFSAIIIKLSPPPPTN